MKNILNLAFFDMDGCLFDTPHPDQGKQKWAEHHQKDYPYQGWWGRVESMDPDVFTIKPREHVLDMWKCLHDSGFENRVLTSRQPKFQPIITSLLIDNNIDMEEVLTAKGSFTKGERILQVVEDAIYQGFLVKEVQFFDDRMKEIVTVEAVREQLESLGIKLIITKIQSDAND